MLTLFVLIILVLGPWWPSQDKARKWKLDLPTDNPLIAACLGSFAFGLFSFYLAWDVYVNPAQPFRRFEKPVAALFGPEGVVVAWILIGAGLLGAAAKAYVGFEKAEPR